MMLFAIVWGTNHYVLKTLSPSQLGLNPLEFNKYTFKIIQKYFHLFWIPLLPTGVNYVVQKQGLSDKYHAPHDIESLMKQHRVPFWHHLGSVALPILLIIGLIYYNVNEKIQNNRYRNLAIAEQKETEKLTSDTAALRPISNKVTTLFSLIATNYKEQKEGFKKIDTSLNKLLPLYLESRMGSKDSNTLFTEKNTLIYHNDFRDFVSQQNDEYDETKLENSWYAQGISSSVVKWYKTGMQKENQSNVYLDDLKKANESISAKKYIAVLRFTGIAAPTLNMNAIQNAKANRKEESSNKEEATPAYESGYATGTVYVYNLETKKIITQFKVLSGNSNSISTMTMNGESVGGTIRSQLENDLIHNLEKEVKYGLRIEKRSEAVENPF
jgi:hypothetical protein